MKVTRTVCDVCTDQDKPAKSYEIRRLDDGITVSKDLCAEHGLALEELLADAPQPTPKKPPKATGGTSRRGPRGITVTSMDDIEKQKAASS